MHGNNELRSPNGNEQSASPTASPSHETNGSSDKVPPTPIPPVEDATEHPPTSDTPPLGDGTRTDAWTTDTLPIQCNTCMVEVLPPPQSTGVGIDRSCMPPLSTRVGIHERMLGDGTRTDAWTCTSKHSGNKKRECAG